jgi:hypothetical protein
LACGPGAQRETTGQQALSQRDRGAKRHPAGRGAAIYRETCIGMHVPFCKTGASAGHCAIPKPLRVGGGPPSLAPTV